MVAEILLPLRVQRRSAAVLGWSAEELLGKPQHSIIHHTRPGGSPYPRDECPIYAAFTDGKVHILGETGVGKERFARASHNLSSRNERPLVKVNCAALPSALIESELFGHEKGAFTGATTQRSGRFELADGGTIFLDEIGELPLELQAKLLRVIQEGEFERQRSICESACLEHRLFGVAVLAAHHAGYSLLVRSVSQTRTDRNQTPPPFVFSPGPSSRPSPNPATGPVSRS